MMSWPAKGFGWIIRVFYVASHCRLEIVKRCYHASLVKRMIRGLVMIDLQQRKHLAVLSALVKQSAGDSLRQW